MLANVSASLQPMQVTAMSPQLHQRSQLPVEAEVEPESEGRFQAFAKYFGMPATEATTVIVYVVKI